MRFWLWVEECGQLGNGHRALPLRQDGPVMSQVTEAHAACQRQTQKKGKTSKHVDACHLQKKISTPIIPRILKHFFDKDLLL